MNYNRGDEVFTNYFGCSIHVLGPFATVSHWCRLMVLEFMGGGTETFPTVVEGTWSHDNRFNGTIAGIDMII
ncbi:hypothetical protein V6Z11_D01G050400 [Gossypium hirsutum]